MPTVVAETVPIAGVSSPSRDEAHRPGQRGIVKRTTTQLTPKQSSARGEAISP
jgi:hypothetical protein